MSNRSASYRFRLEVAQWLHGHGFPFARERAIQGTLSDAMDAQIEGDVLGVPGWLLRVRNEKKIDLSGALTEAGEDALLAGVDHWASLQYRRGHGVSECYVTMPLAVFALVARDTVPARPETVDNFCSATGRSLPCTHAGRSDR